MAKLHPEKTETAVRDPKSGRTLTLHGAGALKGRLTLKKSIDLTKPIASQATKSLKPRRAADIRPKH